jgi:hypothetical protein
VTLERSQSRLGFHGIIIDAYDSIVVSALSADVEPEARRYTKRQGRNGKLLARRGGGG